MARSNHLQLGSSNTHPDEYTRTRLLNRLGLFQQPPTTAAGRRRYPSSAFSGQQIDFSKTTLHPSLVRNGGRAPVLKPAIVTNDNNTTKDDQNDNKDVVVVENNNTIHNRDNKAASDSDECSTDKNKDTDSTKVKFNDTVDIVSIPSRHQFSNRIKNVYWSNRYELQENAERNILEYEYEGWDYDKVVLDDEMYVDVNTGALIHPCHLSVDETTGQTVYNTYAAEEEEELKAADQISNQKLQQQREEMDQEDDGFEYEDDDSYFRPLQRKSSVAVKTFGDSENSNHDYKQTSVHCYFSTCSHAIAF
ncbi:hypothetical protein IV203_032854 [Nitzschia inconspicua]|uniref:Uncharacterized protein n=1 Tax=Nitzschia inconspicua TaxID=303405 RepID=A0A9K3KKD9_9STRA|nr:hypothetical protein IV203_032854 [Nitzschia inconspicua]